MPPAPSEPVAERLPARRAALVIGTEAYRGARRLANPVRDARAIEAALKRLGFAVSIETDRTRRRLMAAIEAFAEEQQGADALVIFFAGHGVQIDGRNFLLPVDAETGSAAALGASALALDDLLGRLAAVAPRRIVLLDACRNDPFGGAPAAPGARGLAVAEEVAPHAAILPGLGRIGRADNTIYAFATAPGTTADDGSGEHSPFTSALIEHLGKKGLEFGSIMKLVQMEVYERTAGRQLPYIEDALPDLFFTDASAAALPERDRLLLAMAKIDRDTRARVELIAAEHDTPLAPLFAALLVDAEADPADLEFRIARAAADFTRVRAELRALGSSDPEVSRLRSQAEHDLSIGAFDAARDALSRAIEVDRASGEEIETRLRERNLSQAASLAARAGVARTRLDYRGAAADFATAAGVAARWDTNEAWRYTLKQADNLRDYGEEFGDTAHIASAIDAYRDGLKFVPRAESADNWADTHNRLGIALRLLGVRRGDAALLQEANAALHDAMQVHTRESHPADWAKLQNNLGINMMMISDYDSSIERVREGVAYFRAAATAATFEADPAAWARVQMNLGNALQALCGRETGTAAAEEAVTVIRRLLEYRTRERDDGDWAATQCILALALTSLGERKSGTELLEEAVAIHRVTLEVFTLERGPVAWGRTHFNIGLVLTMLGDRTESAERYREALEAFHLALEARTRERMPMQWAVTQSALGDVLLRLARLEDSRERFAEALAAMRDALAEQQRDRAPLGWAMTQLSIAHTLREIGRRENGTQSLELSVATFNDALGEISATESPLEWASAQAGLATALRLLGERTADAALLAQSLAASDHAIGAYREAGKTADSDEAAEKREETARILTAIKGRQTAAE